MTRLIDLGSIAISLDSSNANASARRESVRFFTDVIGRADEQAAVEVVNEERLAALHGAILAEFDVPLTISVLRIHPNQLHLYFSDSFAGAIWEPVGIVAPEGQADIIAATVGRFGSPGLANISVEQLPVLEADAVFTFTTDGLTAGDAQTYLQALQADPLSQALAAVKDERLHLVDNYWFGTGYIAAHAVIDDLFVQVLENAPNIQSPFTDDTQAG